MRTLKGKIEANPTPRKPPKAAALGVLVAFGGLLATPAWSLTVVQSYAFGCQDAKPGIVVGGYTFTAYDGEAGVAKSADGRTLPIETSPYYSLDTQYGQPQVTSISGPMNTITRNFYKGSHAPLLLTASTSFVSLTGQAPLVVWDSDNVLRNIDHTALDENFDVANYNNNGYSFKSPTVASCTTIGNWPVRPTPGGWMQWGDYAWNNGTYVSDYDGTVNRYTSDHEHPTGVPERAYSSLTDSWNGMVAEANYAMWPGYAEVPSRGDDLNYPPTPAMLAAVTAEYKAAGIDIGTIPSINMILAFAYHCSDIDIPATPAYSNVWDYEEPASPNNPAFWIYDPLHAAASGAPSGYVDPDPPVLTQTYIAYPAANEAGSANVWTVDGTGTALCDPDQIAANPLLAQAPHAFNGVYCAALASAAPFTVASTGPGDGGSASDGSTAPTGPAASAPAPAPAPTASNPTPSAPAGEDAGNAAAAVQTGSLTLDGTPSHAAAGPLSGATASAENEPAAFASAIGGGQALGPNADSTMPR